VDRYSNDRNGQFNANANEHPSNRKSLACRDLNSNIGRFPSNSPLLSGSCFPRCSQMSYTLLFQKTYDLVKWIYPTVNKFPRKQRLTLSQRIEVTTIRILELVIDLSDRDTAVNRKKILHELHKLQILLRLCKDLSYLSFKRYAYVSFLITEIIQILDKWGGGSRGGLQKFVS